MDRATWSSCSPLPLGARHYTLWRSFEMKRLGLFGLALALVFGLASGACAQFATGNIYGKVVDESGAGFPGANVAITGPTIGTRTTTSCSHGDFGLLKRAPAMHKFGV